MGTDAIARNGIGHKRDGKHMPRGTVSWYSKERGYGFITPEDGGIDVVVYADAVGAAGAETLAEGDVVAFATEPYREFLKATDLKIG